MAAEMETSILKTIRASLGILPDFTDFDPELIVVINSAIMAVSQLVIGLKEGFSITDDTATWATLFDETTTIDGVKSYIIIKFMLEFDPPGTSFLLESFNRQLNELAWRMMVEVDPDLVTTE